MTKRLYYTDHSITGEAIIIGIELAAQPNIVLDQTLFHPAGGGQQSDTGWIGPSRVMNVVSRADGTVAHEVALCPDFEVGRTVPLTVDAEVRQLNCRLHTAGHLIASLASTLMPSLEARAGHHWPRESRVDFAQTEALPQDFADRLTQGIEAAIQDDRRVICAHDQDGRRTVAIVGFSGIPCGGTHLQSLRAIGRIVLRKIVEKKGNVRIGYDVADGFNI